MLINGIPHEEYAKPYYGRLEYRERLLRHDPRHPHAERFAEHEADVRFILESPKGSDEQLNAELHSAT